MLLAVLIQPRPLFHQHRIQFRATRHHTLTATPRASHDPRSTSDTIAARSPPHPPIPHRPTGPTSHTPRQTAPRQSRTPPPPLAPTTSVQRPFALSQSPYCRSKSGI